MSFICTKMKNHFHIKGWALNLVLIQRFGGTRKWPSIMRTSCETGPVLYRLYPRRLESLTVLAALSFHSVIYRPWVLIRPGFEPTASRIGSITCLCSLLGGPKRERGGNRAYLPHGRSPSVQLGYNGLSKPPMGCWQSKYPPSLTTKIKGSCLHLIFP